MSITKIFSAVLLLLGISIHFSIQPALAQKTTKRGFGIDRNITDAQIEAIAARNVNLIYYFLNPNEPSIATDRDTYLANLDRELIRLDEVLAAFAVHNVKVFVNMYGAPGAFADTQTPALHEVFSQAWAQNTLIEAWQVIAERYKSNNTVYGYNLLNEPAERSVAAGLQNWKALSLTLAKTVRAIDPDITIMVMTPYGDPNKVSKIKKIKGLGPNFVYGFNFYHPHPFTHQGLYGAPLNKSYKGGKEGSAKLLKSMKKALEFKKKNKVKLYVPEFTVARWAPASSATKYLSDVIKVLESNGINWSYHTYGGLDSSTSYAYPWSILHSSDPFNNSEVSGVTDRAAILYKYFKKNKK